MRYSSFLGTLITTLTAAVGLLALALPAQAQRGGNPFGQKQTLGYALGPLAGKGQLIDGKERATYQLTTGQSAIKVVSLESGQLGQQAGLQVGDVILGVGGSTFTDKTAATYQLAIYIERMLASSRGGKLPLRVWRGGKVTMLKVPIKGQGRKWASKLIGGSFDYLLSQQDSSGKFGSSMSSNNAHVATTSICGLALIAAGARPGQGKLGEALVKAKDFLVQTAGVESRMGMGGRGGTGTPGMGGRMGGNWSQVNWSLGYGGLFLAEYFAHTGDPAVKTKLLQIKAAIEKNQETNGGWAHGPGGPNALGYTDFAAVSNVCLAAYGAIVKVTKAEANPAVIGKAINYLVGTASGSGGIGYSQRRGQKGHGDPGRTAGAILGFSLCGKTSHPFFRRMTSYFKSNMADVPDGHASPMYHFGMGALGAAKCGASKAFQQMFKYELLMARQTDGSFSARPSKEDKMWGRKSDSMQGPSWATGTYLLAWTITKGKLKLVGK